MHVYLPASHLHAWFLEQDHKYLCYYTMLRSISRHQIAFLAWVWKQQFCWTPCFNSTALWNGSDDITRFRILTPKHPLNQASSEQFWCKLLTNSCLQSFTLCIRPINHDSHKCTTQWELGAVFGGLFKCIGLFNLNNTSTTMAITRYAKADGSLTMVIVLTGGYICLQLPNDHMLHQWQY